jgi:hypothetical protein
MDDSKKPAEKGESIGLRRVPKLTGVTVTKRPVFGTTSATGFGAPQTIVTPGPPRNTTLVQVRRQTAVPAAVSSLTAVVAPLAAAAIVPPTTAVATPTAAIAPPTAAIVPTGVSSLKPVVRAAPIPEESPMVPADFFGTSSKTIRAKIQETNPVEIAPADKIYRPLSAPSFQDFIVQTFAQFSPTLMRVLQSGNMSAAKLAQALDPDACKRRDPNKIETFYYQKFVRDYLSRGTPYRGLLVYHGLGSGKTCTSIAAAEALYWGGQKKIYVLAPATLSNNYRRELGKCGYFPLRTHNYWEFLPIKDFAKKPNLEIFWLQDVLGLPYESIVKQGGGWVPNPDKPSNWDSLSDSIKESIRKQQRAHLNHRFSFIHYNGVTPTILSQLASAGVKEGKSMFDDAVVVIEEIHNLVRTINGTEIGGKPVSVVIDQIEPREPTWSTPLGRERPGFRYPRGYTLYRLLQNAVGCKVIALSATPMINYAQELAILLNILGGEQRMIEISLKGVSRDPNTTARITQWAQQHPEIDFYALEEAADRSIVLNVTPVPFGFAKVVGTDYATRGFLRLPPIKIGKIEKSRERTIDLWAVQLLQELGAQGILRPSIAEEAAKAVETARKDIPGISLHLTTPAFRIHTFPMLPEDAKQFVSHFIDRNTLSILNAPILKARASGLISYYRGGSEEMMPRIVRNEEVRVPMSEFMFQEYSRARLREMEMEQPIEKRDDGEEQATKKKGMTRAEMDLYSQATKTQQTGFLALSRAACNWVFPTEVPRPSMSIKQQVQLLGVEKENPIVTELVEETAETQGKGAEGAETTESVIPDEPNTQPVPTKEEEDLAKTMTGIIGTLMSGLEAPGSLFLSTHLATYSPKYAMILENIRASSGPVLVYSQFKTLEGLGIFSAALRASSEQYLPLDIQKTAGGVWEIPETLVTEFVTKKRPAYILYTGDQELEKRRLLLQLYNADVPNLPPRLAEQCTALLAGDTDNRAGRICKIFMITQSGAEGISLFNTRQVHIMEPYWNNVRLQQVIGRAIRLCSHMNLPWDERTVEIFTYLSVFSEKQKAEGSKQLMMADNGMTTDQTIFDIATKKQVLANGLMEIAQSAAVDCELHYHEHGAVTQCFRFAEKGRPLFMFHPDWKKDLQASVRTV